MRITIVTGFFLPVPPLAGGATERSWHGLAKEFAAAGHHVTLVSRRWPGLPDAEDSGGVTHVRVRGFNHRKVLAANLLFDLLWGFRVAGSLPQSDVVICNTVTLPAWLGWIRPSAGTVAVLIGRTPKGQTLLYQRVRRIYVPSSSVLAQIASKSVLRRSQVVGYPIEWTLLASRNSRDSRRLTIGYIGRIHPEKGIELLVAAALLLSRRKGLPKWRIVITGPSTVPQGGGGERWLDGVKASAAPLGDQIEWRDPVFEKTALAEVYGGTDIFCYPSMAERGETFGVAVAEAMAARCAVVVSALGCFSDLVKHGETGMVFDQNSDSAAESLSDAVAQLLEDGVLRDSLAGRGQAHSRRFDYPEVAAKMLADLSVLTGGQDRNPP